MEQITKTPEQVVAQIEKWFLRFYNKEKSDFSSADPFTMVSFNKDFYWHDGFISIRAESDELKSVKSNGYFQKFGLRKTDGTVIYWNVATGKAGYAFWNITKKFHIIGRRYLITS